MRAHFLSKLLKPVPLPVGLRSLTAAAQAQPAAAAYPSKPVHITVANTPGSSPDVLARYLAQRLSEQWKQPVVVDNRAGAAGILAADGLAKAQPDGYSLLVGADGPHHHPPQHPGRIAL